MTFETVWDVVKAPATKHAYQSVAAADADDLLSILQFQVWEDSTKGAWECLSSLDHARAYYLKKFKWRVIDFIRSRGRRNEHIEAAGDMLPRSTNGGIYLHVYASDVLDTAAKMGHEYEVICRGIMEGETLTDMGKTLGLCTATVTRRVKDIMKRMIDDERVIDGDVIDQQPTGGAKLATKKKTAAKKPATKKTKKVDVTTLPVKPAVDLAKVKDFPKDLAAWRKKCGGENYCLGGSGQPVKSRFKPGFDAKLKSALKRVGTANAKAIAAELGWAKMIKWA